MPSNPHARELERHSVADVGDDGNNLHRALIGRLEQGVGAVGIGLHMDLQAQVALSGFEDPRPIAV